MKNENVIRQAIEARTNRIAALQDEIKTIQAAASLIGGRESEKSPRRAKPQAHQRFNVGPRKAPVAVSPAPAGAVNTALDKPTSVGAAMKGLIRSLAGKAFTGEGLRQKLEMDDHTAALLEASSAGVVAGNLTYWTKQGYLAKDGETPLESSYTVTPAGEEWFGV